MSEDPRSNKDEIDAVRIFNEWLRSFQKHQMVIEMENDGFGKVADKLKRDLGKDVFIYLLNSERSNELVQRGGKDTNSKEIPANILRNHVSVKRETRDVSYIGPAFYEIYLGAVMPVENTLSQVALEAYKGGMAEELLKAKAQELKGKYNEEFNRGDDYNFNERAFWIAGKFRQHFEAAWKGPNKDTKKKCLMALEGRIEKEMRGEGHNRQAGLQRKKRGPGSSGGLYFIFVPVYCWGLPRAVWVYGTQSKPSYDRSFAPNVDADFELILSNRFSVYCAEAENLQDQGAPFGHLYSACSSFWSSKYILALDDSFALCSPPSSRIDFDAETERQFKNSIVFALDEAAESKFRTKFNPGVIFAPQVSHELSSYFARRIGKMFGGLRYIVWTLEDRHVALSAMGKANRRSYNALARSIVRGLDLLRTKKESLEVAVVKGEEKKAKEILPDWAHAYGGYLAMLKGLVANANDPRARRLDVEIDSAWEANEALIRWPQIGDWRTHNPSEHLNTLRLAAVKDEDSGTRSNVTCEHARSAVNYIITSLKHLLAKIACDRESYANALRYSWFPGSSAGSIEAFLAEASQTLNKRFLAPTIIESFFKEQKCDISITKDGLERLKGTSWPRILPVAFDERDKARKERCNFGVLIQFLVDELLFNSFKHSKAMPRNGRLPFINVDYRQVKADMFGTLSISNSHPNAKKRAEELNNPDVVGPGRGHRLVQAIAYIIGGAGHDKVVFTGTSSGIFTAKVEIPIISSE